MKALLNALFIISLLSPGMTSSGAQIKAKETNDAPHLYFRTAIKKYFTIADDNNNLILTFPVCYNFGYLQKDKKYNTSIIEPTSEIYKAAKDIFENVENIEKVTNIRGEGPLSYIFYAASKDAPNRDWISLNTQAPQIIKIYQVLEPQIEKQRILAENNPDCNRQEDQIFDSMDMIF